VSQQLPIALLKLLEQRNMNTRFTQPQLLVEISLGAVGSEEKVVSQLLLESSPVLFNKILISLFMRLLFEL
jgi:hypothetical protein